MDEDEESYSYPSASPSSTGRISVTVASTPPQNTLTLALPIQPKTGGGSSGGGGREDCWSEGATEVLIDAWGERYVELSRGNLKQQDWKDVADIVCSREEYTKTPKTDVQCKNRIDTVKKKYKVEKAKIDSHGGSSRWRFYDRIDELIGPSAAKPAGGKIPMAIPVGIRSGVQQKPNLRLGKRTKVEFSDEESEPENSGDSSDGLPPPVSYKRPTVRKEVAPVSLKQGSVVSIRKSGESESSGNSMRELTASILKFGEAYEQVETEKLQQMVEMEKRRMKFAKDMELQRMQSFMKMQVELLQLMDGRQEENNGNGEINENDNDKNNNGVDNNNNNDNDNDDHNNNSDSSS